MKTLKVGFDLDGVILYNPIRIFRSFISDFLKKKIMKKENKIFYIPQSPILKYIWRLLHKTSFMIDPGFSDLIKISKNKKFKLYLITGRYNFLEKDYQNWLKKISADKIFIQCFLNRDNLQPNKFKEKMIKKLNLDIYVEDNFDIIEKLNHKTKAKIIWISNLVDRNISYKFKFFSLREVCQYLKKLV